MARFIITVAVDSTYRAYDGRLMNARYTKELDLDAKDRRSLGPVIEKALHKGRRPDDEIRWTATKVREVTR